MCGIAATFGAGENGGVGALTDLMLRRLAHRGPDGVGVAHMGRAVVGHARLAIVDVAGGQQPMQDSRARNALACNGEIYNHLLLRRALGSEHAFKSECDSEVVLHLFSEFGRDCVHQLDGMFAFFVTDGASFLAARDPFGIKPLYVGTDAAGGLWFASELKALQDSCVSISTLPPGAYLADGETCRWFSPRWTAVTRSDVAPAPHEIVERLERAVVKRLMSDVPVGVLLSGGLDSSLVAALARRHMGRLRTYAVGVEGAPDLSAARHVARVLGAEHSECVYSLREVERHLERVIYHLESYDAALVRSAVPCYFVSELAAEEVKVVLTGEGADELFAGYSYMRRIADPAELHRECVRLLGGLHAMNLQRVDRMTMAHGLEGRVPFLDVDFVDYAMRLDPAYKVQNEGVAEKRVLRRAAERVLPREIAHRPKLEFSQGTSNEGLLGAYAEERISDRELSQAAARFPRDTPRDKEELLYRLIFENLFPGDKCLDSVARWRVPPAAAPTA